LNEIVFSQEAKITPNIAVTNPMRFLISNANRIQIMNQSIRRSKVYRYGICQANHCLL
jgi:hypothetical protein